jgi:hypothetical protein
MGAQGGVNIKQPELVRTAVAQKVSIFNADFDTIHNNCRSLEGI